MVSQLATKGLGQTETRRGRSQGECPWTTAMPSAVRSSSGYMNMCLELLAIDRSSSSYEDQYLFTAFCIRSTTYEYPGFKIANLNFGVYSTHP